jgi:hypothetical protein
MQALFPALLHSFIAFNWLRPSGFLLNKLKGSCLDISEAFSSV